MVINILYLKFQKVYYMSYHEYDFSFTSAKWGFIQLKLLRRSSPTSMTGIDVILQSNMHKLYTRSERYTVKSFTLSQNVAVPASVGRGPRNTCGMWLLLLRSLFDIAWPTLPKPAYQRLFVGSWLLFCFVLAASYKAKFITFLTVPPQPRRIQTLQELADSKFRWELGYIRGTVHALLYIWSKISDARATFWAMLWYELRKWLFKVGIAYTTTMQTCYLRYMWCAGRGIKRTQFSSVEK